MKFDCLVIDPPWQYDNKRTGGTHKSGAEQKYDIMDFLNISTLSIHLDKVMADNSVIFLWITNPMLERGLQLLKLWNYEYKTMITWVKKSYGMGYWFRGKTEHILFGVKGNVKAFRLNTPNLIVSNKTLKHSQKPIEFYNLVQKSARTMLDQQDYLTKINILELFARKPVEIFKVDGANWTCLGKEITGNDIREDLSRLILEC
jgi:N6-adenosine-specific RNA methylase IME4